VTKRVGQSRSSVAVTRAERRRGGCWVQEEGNQDGDRDCRSGRDAPPKRPEKKPVSFFRVLPPSLQQHTDLSNRRCLVRRSRRKPKCTLSFPDNLKFIRTRRTFGRYQQHTPSGGRIEPNGISITHTEL
jgi:hypothetical protein